MDNSFWRIVFGVSFFVFSFRVSNGRTLFINSKHEQNCSYTHIAHTPTIITIVYNIFWCQLKWKHKEFHFIATAREYGAESRVHYTKYNTCIRFYSMGIIIFPNKENCVSFMDEEKEMVSVDFFSIDESVLLNNVWRITNDLFNWMQLQ